MDGITDVLSMPFMKKTRSSTRDVYRGGAVFVPLSMLSDAGVVVMCHVL